MSEVSSKAVFARSTRLLLIAAALFISTLGAPIAGKAQSVDSSQETPNAWTKVCSDVITSRSNRPFLYSWEDMEMMEVCHTYAQVPHDQAASLLRSSGLVKMSPVVGVLQVQALKRTLLTTSLPFHAFRNHPPVYLLFHDGTRIELGTWPDPDGGFWCYASVDLSERLLERIKADKALTLVVADASGRSLSIPLPCCGFA